MRLASFFALLVVWWLASLAVPAAVPSPGLTAAMIRDNVASGVVAGHVFATLNRVFWGFALAMGLGIATGMAMGFSSRAERILDLWVMVALTIPGLCYAIVAFLWIGLNEVAAVCAVAITAFPSIAITIREGAKGIDNRLVDMATAFGAGRPRRVWRVVVPQLMPYVMAAGRYGLGIIWKITVLVELLGLSSGVGYMLNYWFQLNNMAQVFAWTAMFTAVMIFLELGVLQQLERRLFAWRPAARA
ncbi:MAG: ABC transporter permease subunit [Burkholderiales bacterium]|nr:ABC transporter permease subunit [Burkholderiales bacterium]